MKQATVRVYIAVCSICGPAAAGAQLTRTVARQWLGGCSFRQVGIDKRKHVMSIVVGTMPTTKTQAATWLTEEKNRLKQ